MNETDLAKKIKEIKNSNRLTNDDLAARSDLPVSIVSKFLSGATRHPTIDTVQKLAAALNVSIDYLVFDENAPGNKTINSSEFSLLENYRALNSKGKERLLELSILFKDSPTYKT